MRCMGVLEVVSVLPLVVIESPWRWLHRQQVNCMSASLAEFGSLLELGSLVLVHLDLVGLQRDQCPLGVPMVGC